jgi:2C-methyl-D-erythritol 2,4-cyclodiphosphate synthase
MGSEDARLWEDAMSTLRDDNYKLKQMNTELRQQNTDLKDFLKHMHNEIANFLQYNSIKKKL